MPPFDNDWRFIEISEEGAFLSLQHRECQQAVGEGAKLHNLLLALRRDQKASTIASVWYSKEQVTQANFEIDALRRSKTGPTPKKAGQAAEDGAIKQERTRKNQQDQNVVEADHRLIRIACFNDVEACIKHWYRVS